MKLQRSTKKKEQRETRIEVERGEGVWRRCEGRGGIGDVGRESAGKKENDPTVRPAPTPRRWRSGSSLAQGLSPSLHSGNPEQILPYPHIKGQLTATSLRTNPLTG